MRMMLDLIEHPLKQSLMLNRSVPGYIWNASRFRVFDVINFRASTKLEIENYCEKEIVRK